MFIYTFIIYRKLQIGAIHIYGVRGRIAREDSIYLRGISGVGAALGDTHDDAQQQPKHRRDVNRYVRACKGHCKRAAAHSAATHRPQPSLNVHPAVVDPLQVPTPIRIILFPRPNSFL
eukprot:GHVU01143796.1.p1 GENE.GHVU01143796.1~~GHVU01143796.1.p1  ORF type:complete len:118 (-),score=3.71 GHVU01143796.1:103-456(-)